MLAHSLDERIAEFLDAVRSRSLRAINRAPLRREDAEEAFQDASLAFALYLRRLELLSPLSPQDPYRHEGLWWTILRQRANGKYHEMMKRQTVERPYPVVRDGEGTEKRAEANCPDGQPTALDRCLDHERESERARFLALACRKRGGKVVAALIKLGRASGYRSHRDLIEFVDAYLFPTEENRFDRRVDVSVKVANAAGTTRAAVYSNVLRARCWWMDLKAGVLG
jgi:hypothetical protein